MVVSPANPSRPCSILVHNAPKMMPHSNRKRHVRAQHRHVRHHSTDPAIGAAQRQARSHYRPTPTLSTRRRPPTHGAPPSFEAPIRCGKAPPQATPKASCTTTRRATTGNRLRMTRRRAARFAADANCCVVRTSTSHEVLWRRSHCVRLTARGGSPADDRPNGHSRRPTPL